MNPCAIPTTYKGVRFRSRLEAKWAAFFDLVGWTWHYEQDDFNGWIADFTIDSTSTGKTACFVEVKPIEEPPDDELQLKIARSGALEFGRCVLIVGKRPLLENRECASHLGWYLEVVETGSPEPCLSGACCGFWNGRLGFCSATMSFHDVISGEYDGNCPDDARAFIDKTWCHASNSAQWMPR